MRIFFVFTLILGLTLYLESHSFAQENSNKNKNQISQTSTSTVAPPKINTYPSGFGKESGKLVGAVLTGEGSDFFSYENTHSSKDIGKTPQDETKPFNPLTYTQKNPVVTLGETYNPKDYEIDSVVDETLDSGIVLGRVFDEPSTGGTNQDENTSSTTTAYTPAKPEFISLDDNNPSSRPDELNRNTPPSLYLLTTPTERFSGEGLNLYGGETTTLEGGEGGGIQLSGSERTTFTNIHEDPFLSNEIITYEDIKPFGKYSTFGGVEDGDPQLPEVDSVVDEILSIDNYPQDIIKLIETKGSIVTVTIETKSFKEISVVPNSIWGNNNNFDLTIDQEMNVPGRLILIPASFGASMFTGAYMAATLDPAIDGGAGNAVLTGTTTAAPTPQATGGIFNLLNILFTSGSAGTITSVLTGEVTVQGTVNYNISGGANQELKFKTQTPFSGANADNIASHRANNLNLNAQIATGANPILIATGTKNLVDTLTGKQAASVTSFTNLGQPPIPGPIPATIYVDRDNDQPITEANFT